MENMTLQVGKRVRSRLHDRRRQRGIRLALYALAGFLLSAVTLGGYYQPLALGFVCAVAGEWNAVWAALGGAVGYLVCWGADGAQGVVWMGLALALALLVGRREIAVRQRMLMPALAALTVSGSGVLFLMRFGDNTPVGAYLIRVLVATGSTTILPYLRDERPIPLYRRGEAAIAQVRLEQTAMVLRQMEQTLLLAQPAGPDRTAVLLRAVDAACDNCPERRQCRARSPAQQLSPAILEQAGLTPEDLPPGCKKSSRLLGELRRGQEQLRRMKGQQSREAACREAVREQYQFLAEYLQSQSDSLAMRRNYRPPKFDPEVGLSTRSLEADNGDQCAWFAGLGNQYFVVLCDGMGTGTGAMEESRAAINLLRQWLSAGLPAEYALRNLNSLSILRELGGCATVDLVQIALDTGRASLYKWGAASSYLAMGGQLRKIGTAGPPPGLSQQSRETVYRLSLGGGEVLILLSDGAGEEGLLQSKWTAPGLSPGEMAAVILERSGDAGDDATAVVVRLVRPGSSTQ